MTDTIRLPDDAIEDWATSPRDAVSSIPGLSLTVRNLQKSFEDRQVLNGLNFRILAGQFVAIVGKSGCGKSTLLRLIVGLDRPSGGEFWFGADSKAVRD